MCLLLWTQGYIHSFSCSHYADSSSTFSSMVARLKNFFSALFQYVKAVCQQIIASFKRPIKFCQYRTFFRVLSNLKLLKNLIFKYPVYSFWIFNCLGTHVCHFVFRKGGQTVAKMSSLIPSAKPTVSQVARIN